MNSQSALPAEPIRFPDGFGWGTATASYQIEGAPTADGRGPSIWDTFSHTPGKIVDGTNGDRACDHYNRYLDDVELLAGLGAPYYRFSLAWPRIQPDGKGKPNQKGLDFYKRLIEALRAKNIIPWVTLYHWDLPQALEDAGGWPARDTAYRLADYAGIAFAALSDEVEHWTTLNEPICSSFLSYADGEHAPGRQEPLRAVEAAHHLLLGHGLAIDRWRHTARDCHRFGITINLTPVVAASESEADRDAARRVDAITNRFFLDPVLKGEYPADAVAQLAPLTDFSHVLDGDLATINQPLNDFGLNYYHRDWIKAGPADADRFRPGTTHIGAADAVVADSGLPVTARNWPVDPEGLTGVLTWLTETYQMPPIWVTENGSAWDDTIAEDGAVHDSRRIAYLDAHFRAAKKALDQGVDLRGYFVWTSMDNFEWGYGESSRFGLVYLDFETQERTPKDSYHWYQKVVSRNGLAN
ncbi:MAG: beta-glucosidase [Bifidobacteriaceae bacterium]|jgi:beta-glucosidase|nr:beta-glucosidase [Bifidobacteriaceae bacterium]